LSLKTKSPLAIHFLAVGFFEREFDLAQLPPCQKTIIRVPDIIVEFTVISWLMGVMPPNTINIANAPRYWSFRCNESKKLGSQNRLGSDSSYPALPSYKTNIGYLCGSYHLPILRPEISIAIIEILNFTLSPWKHYQGYIEN
jgi:hypothetical protein